MPIRKRENDVVKTESVVKRRTMFEPANHPLSQSIDQTNNQIDDETNDQPLKPTINQPVDPTSYQTINPATHQPISQTIKQSNEEPLFDDPADIDELLMKQATKQAIKPEFNPFDPSNRSLNRSVRPSVDESLEQSVKLKLKAEPSFNQTSSQSINQTLNTSNIQSVVKRQIDDDQSFNSPIKHIINSDDELDEKDKSGQSNDQSNNPSDDDGPPALDMDDFFGQFMMKSDATINQSTKPSTTKPAPIKQSTKKSKKKSPKKPTNQTTSEVKHCMPPITPDRHSKFQSSQSNNQSINQYKSPDPTLLILGSCPSEASLLAQQYYAHKQNHFWPIIGRLFDIDWLMDRSTSQTINYQAKIDCLIDCSIALWDSIGSFQRIGSMDQSIDQPIQNDVLELVEQYQSIKMIGCNGSTSYKMCLQSIKHSVTQSNSQHIHLVSNPSNNQSMLLSIKQRTIKIVQLPSSSPAHAMKDAVKQKAEKWRALLELD